MTLIGLYVTADKVANIFKVVLTNYNDAFTPNFFKIAKKNENLAGKYAVESAIKFNYLMCFGTLFFTLFSYEVVFLILDDRYINSYKFIPILCLAINFKVLYSFSVAGLFFKKQTLKISIVAILSGILNIILNLILIPKYGVIAACLSTAISYLFNYIIISYISGKFFKIKIEIFKIFFPISFVILATIFVYFINQHVFLNNNYDLKILILKIFIFFIYIILILFLDFQKIISQFREVSRKIGP